MQDESPQETISLPIFKSGNGSFDVTPESFKKDDYS